MLGRNGQQPLRRASFWGEDVLKLIVVLAAQFCEHTKANAFNSKRMNCVEVEYISIKLLFEVRVDV